MRDPNGTIIDNWSQTFSENFFSSYWYWTVTTSTLEGVWTFSATYNGQTETREFIVGENLSITNENPVGLAAFPNPVKNILTFKTATPVSTLIVRDAAGREVFSRSKSNLHSTLDFSTLSSGVYFVTGISKVSGEQSTLRVVKR